MRFHVQQLFRISSSISVVLWRRERRTGIQMAQTLQVNHENTAEAVILVSAWLEEMVHEFGARTFLPFCRVCSSKQLFWPRKSTMFSFWFFSRSFTVGILPRKKLIELWCFLWWTHLSNNGGSALLWSIWGSVRNLFKKRKWLQCNFLMLCVVKNH